MEYIRQRTQSEYEEKNISEFVDTAVNFETNVSFYTADEGKKIAEEVLQPEDGIKSKQIILLIGHAADMSNTDKVADFFPYYSEDVREAIAEAGEGKAYVASILSSARILVAVIPTKASRHNSPHRPDVITTVVNEALKQLKGGSTDAGVDVYSFITSEIAVAASIARASANSFSAKGGKAENGYINAGAKIRVAFAAPKVNVGLEAVARSVQLCQFLVSAPTNLLDTTTFTEIAVRHAAGLKEAGIPISVEIIAGEDLREKGYGGLYGVGKAAEFPPHLVTLIYDGPEPTSRISFVGKGIVYDTGGLAIKSGVGMRGMKGDMGGAAAVFCGFLALAQLGLPIQMSTTLCLADNAVGPRSQRNDDIARLKSGITVEINNTDAEGRLVLGDGVFHASALLPYTPEVIVDMATLTGAQGIATGRYHAALYVNDEECEKTLMDAGKVSGDLVFPVVFCPEFHNLEYPSSVADYTNSVANRNNAQVSCAGQFIGNNLCKSYKGVWAHVDMASPAAPNSSATGYGVALLVQAFAGALFSDV